MHKNSERNEAIVASVRLALEALGLDAVRNGPFFGIGERPSVLSKAA